MLQDEFTEEIKRIVESSDEETQALLLLIFTHYFVKAMVHLFQENPPKDGDKK